MIIGTPPSAVASNANAGLCDARFCAGAARADITPPVTTPMWGYNARVFYSQYGCNPDITSGGDPGCLPSNRWLQQHTHGVDTDHYQKGAYLRSEGIATRLYARALDIRNSSGVELVLVQVDLGAMTGEMWRAAAERVAPLGISRDHLLISATHTHAGPGSIQQPPAHALLVGDNYDPRVVKRTVDGVVKAITEAHERLAPAMIAIGQAQLVGAANNRSFVPHHGYPTPTHNGLGFPDPNNGRPGDPCPDPQAIDDGTTCDHDPNSVVNPDGCTTSPSGETCLSAHAIDPTITMIRVDRTDGVPLGVWTNFAIHGTVFGGDNLLFSGDNQGFTERLVEDGIAQRAAARGTRLPPGWQVIDADANGTEGDIAPYCHGYNDSACAEQVGTLQAQHVLALYDSLGKQLVDDVPLGSRLDVLYMEGEDGTSPLAIFGAGPDCPVQSNQPPFNSDYYGQGRKCPFLVLTGLGPAWFWVQAMRIGDYVLASVPGEMTVQMGRRLRKRILCSPANQGTCDAAGNLGGNPIVHHAVIVGLANDYMSYITTPEEYDFQYYEGTFTLWGRNEGPLMLDRMGALTDELLERKPGPTYVEPPDTSGTQADNVSPLTQALSAAPLTQAPGTVLARAPAAIKRGQVASFTWVGGQPSAEVVQDQALVTTQCLAGKSWNTAFTDEAPDDLTDYARDGIEDHWDTRWDVPLDAPATLYRFAVTGDAYVGGRIVPYSVTSMPVQVSPSDALSVIAAAPLGTSTLVEAAYPAPDPKSNFRLRPAGPTSGSVTITITHQDGTTSTGTGTYSAAQRAYVAGISSQPGDTVSVAPGGLVDAYGNRNGNGQSLRVAASLPPPVDTGITLPVAAGLPTPSVEVACGGRGG